MPRAILSWIVASLVLGLAYAQVAPVNQQTTGLIRSGQHYGTGRPLGGMFSPDRTRFALIGTFGVQVYTLAAPDIPQTFDAEVYPALDAAFSPDGAHLLVVANDYALRRYDLLSNAAPVKVYPDAAAYGAQVAYHPDGEQAAIASYDENGEILLIDPMTLETQARIETGLGLPSALAYSPDGAWLVVGLREGAVGVLDAQSGQIEGVLTGHTADVTDVAFSEDGGRLYTVSADGTVRAYSRPDGTFIETLPADGFDLTPADAPRLSITPNLVTVTDPAAGRSFDIPFMAEVYAVDITADGAGIALGGSSPIGGLYSPEGVLYGNFFVDAPAVRALAFSRDGGVLAVGTDENRLYLFGGDGDLLTTLEELPAAVSAVGFSPDAARLYVGLTNGALLTYDALTFALLSDVTLHDGMVSELAVSADGRLVATGGMDGLVVVWDVALQAPVATFNGHRAAVSALDFSPDSARIVSGGYDNAAYVWDVATRTEALPLPEHYGTVTSAHFSPDGLLVLTTCDDAGDRLYDAQTGAQLAVFYDQNASTLDGAWLADNLGFVTVGVSGFGLLYEVVP